MIRTMHRSLLAFATLALVGTANGFDEKTAYELPEDGKTAVIELDYKGGFTPPRKKDDPALSILADGTVLMPDRYGMSKDVTGKLSQRELQELLRFVILDQQFAKIDPAALKLAVQEEQKKRGGFAIQIADAPNTWVRVSVKGHEHEAQYYALGMAANQNPTVDGLQDFHAIEKRLQNVMNIVRGGGREQIARILKLANAELQKQHPDAAPLTMEHLRSAYVGPDGTRRYSLGWNAQGMPGVPAAATYVNASVNVPEKGDPEVTIRAKL